MSARTHYAPHINEIRVSIFFLFYLRSVFAMVEDRVNAMRGYKATLSNPKVSDEAKEHAHYMLDNELGGDRPREEIHAAQGAGSRDSTRVAAGYKAAKKNPRVSDEGKERASQKLRDMSETPDE